MKKRAGRAVDEPRRLVDDELAHVAFAEVELDAGRHSAFAGQCGEGGLKLGGRIAYLHEVQVYLQPLCRCLEVLDRHGGTRGVSRGRHPAVG